MNCREAERLIDTFYDGELDGRSMRDAAMHITRCKHCESELAQRERVQGLLSGTIEHEIADIDLGSIWAAVEPTLDLAGSRSTLRVAAASSRVGGLLLGRRHVIDRGDETFDPGTWEEPPSRTHRAWRWPAGPRYPGTVRGTSPGAGSASASQVSAPATG